MKKFLYKIASVGTIAVGLLSAGKVFATSTYVDVTGGIASTTAYIGEFFSDISPFIWLAIGVPLAFFVIRKIVGLVRG